MVSKRGAKQKGSNAERDVIKLFWNTGEWVAHRMAGSGSSQYPSPDIIAGNGVRFLAIEVKITSENARYFPKKEIEELKFFSQKFGSEAWIAIKFFRKEWSFLNIEDLRETDNSFVAESEDAERKGLSFEQLTKGF
ncbi:MAG: Holliday junction resolvase Hjc [Candidatus Woesearchaeota archaeon]